MLVLLAACAPLPSAPAPVDAAVGWLWAAFPDAWDVELAAAVAELDPTVADLTADDAWEGTLADLDPALDALVPAPAPVDPAEASGVARLATLPCAPEALADLAVATTPAELYPHAFDTWERAWSTPADAWPATPALGWHARWTGDLGVHAYTAEGDGGLRWVAPVEGVPVGAVFLARSWLAGPAEVDAPAALDQDWTLELAWEGADGTTRHGWFLWREARYGLGLDTGVLEVQDGLLDGLRARDEALAAACTDPA